jgi:hypothetical protein
MKLLKDYQGRDVRLTEERLHHILEHPEMANLESALEKTLRQPQYVIQSRTRSRGSVELPILRGHQSGRQVALCCGKVWHERCICGYGVSDRPIEERRATMAEKVRIWFDAEADFLEVRFSDKPGFMRETKNDAVMERVDKRGRVLGFSIMQVSRLSKQRPIEAELETA